MPSADAARAVYDRALGFFDLATISRAGSDYSARARLYSETGDPLGTDAIEQTRVKAIVQAEGLIIVPRRGDVLTIAGHEPFVVQVVDDFTRRIQGVVIAYELTL